MVKVKDDEFPDHLFYDMENQIWYEPLGDGTVRAGFTAWAVTFMGEVLVFTPKRVGRDFEKGKSFAVVEGGKWVGSAR
ncbi:MAG TPA: glycine cleavage system protein H, partial [Xanthobacteraceae bacterium]|nr:glycine cleavage system protein H [Xanthobacteraceae bacterium]